MAEIEREIGKAVQGDIPLTERPFRLIGEEVGSTEEDIIGAIQKMRKDGAVRKFGAVLRHQKAGYTRNAMVLWSVKTKDIEEAGIAFSSCKEVTHCYERSPAFEGKYNVFTMVHVQENEDPEDTVQRLSLASGIKDYKVLESLEEFKKSSMEYF